MSEDYTAALQELQRAREAFNDAKSDLYQSICGWGMEKLRLPFFLRERFVACEAAEQRWHRAIDASVAAAERVNVPPPITRDEDWHATIRAMARAEYSRSWRTEERWQEVAAIAGEAVRNAYGLDAQQQAQATRLYLEMITALRERRV